MISSITSFFQGKFYQNPIVHAVITVLTFAIPYVITQNNLDTITIGGVLRAVSQYLETKNS